MSRFTVPFCVFAVIIPFIVTALAHGAWITQYSGVSTTLVSVKAVTDSIAWAAGANGVVVRTIDGGTTWTSVGGGAVGNTTLHTIDAVNANIAFVTNASSNTYIFRTINGGVYWDTVFIQSGGFVNGIHMFDTLNGVAAGDPVGGKWTILKTTDGGASWVRIATEPDQAGSEAGWQNSLSAVDSNHIWFGTNNKRIYRTTDGGLTWSWGATIPNDSYGVCFNDTLHGFAGFSDDPAARTSDGGGSWTAVTVPGAAIVIGGIAGVNTSDFWCTKGYDIYHSSDTGATWSFEYYSIYGQNHLSFVSSGPTGWCVGDSGSIVKYTPGNSVSSRPEAVLPNDYLLMQNYPNPVSSSTMFRFAIQQQGFVSLKLFNVIGKEVATLVSEQMHAGVHSVQWNASGYAKGVYFYRLKVNNVCQTKKLILCK